MQKNQPAIVDGRSAHHGGSIRDSPFSDAVIGPGLSLSSIRDSLAVGNGLLRRYRYAESWPTFLYL